MAAAGKRDRHILIEHAPEPWPQAVGTGKPTPDWGSFCDPWAERRPLNQREMQALGQTVSLSLLAYVVPDDSNTRRVTAHKSFRLVDGGRAYNVKAVVPSLRRGDTITFIAEGRAD